MDEEELVGREVIREGPEGTPPAWPEPGSAPGVFCARLRAMQGRDRVRQIVQVALAAAGVGAALVMLGHTDFHALRRFGPWAAVVLGIEGTRILAEALATRSLHGDAVRVPWYPLLRAHAAGYALANTLPAGRSVAEATKAVMLAPWAEVGRSAGVAATNQSLVLLAAGALSVAWSFAARSLDQSALAWTVAVQGATVVGLGAALLSVVRSQAIASWVGVRFPRAAATVAGARDGARARGLPVAFVCFAYHRAAQALQLFLLLGALGRWDTTRALALAGAAIVGTTVGVVTPGQVGAVGGALALAGPGVGVPAPQALAMALMIHAAQFSWASFGIVLWSTTRRPRPAGE